ncbi:MAG: 2-hydroxyacyl-CoA dehydratase subunit D, partial [bacterium]
MNKTIEKYGDFLSETLPKHPGLVRRLLSLTYHMLSLQAWRFPSRRYGKAREYLQGYTAKVLGDMLASPKSSAVVNIFMPCEIFHALDLRVTAPEALAVYVTNTACEQPFIKEAEANGAAETFCSFHRVLLGLAETGVLKKPAMIAHTTLACDANQLSFRRLEELWGCPRVVIDVPQNREEEAVAYVAKQLEDLVPLAEEAAGRRLDPLKLQGAVAYSIKCQEHFEKYLTARAKVHLPEAMTPELLNIINNHLYLGTEEAAHAAELLRKDVKGAPPIGNRKKILWMHVLPNYQDEVKEIFQGEADVEVIGCDLAYDAFVQMDPEKPFESMARRMVQSSYNGPGSRRIGETLRRAREMRADGVIIFCQWGCKQTQGLAFEAKRVFEANGFPTLVLDGDGCDRTNAATAQTTTRAKAFLEELRQYLYV